MCRNYGENMQAFSHGEAYLKIIQTRIQDKGIYLLDEPEAALSPLKQLSLIAFILDILKKDRSQFIIASHSPIHFLFSFWGPIFLIWVYTSFSILMDTGFSTVLEPFFPVTMGATWMNPCG